jgi:hypothetical protein
MKTSRIVILLFLFISYAIAFAVDPKQDKGGSPNDSSQQQASTPQDPFADTVPRIVQTTCNQASVKKDALNIDSTGVWRLTSQINWTNSVSPIDAAKPIPTINADTVYVISLTEWQAAAGKYSLISSGWYVYTSDGTNLILANETNSADKPVLPYGSKNVALLAMQVITSTAGGTFDDIVTKNPFYTTFGVSVTKVNAENWSNLGAVFGAFFGVGKGLAATTATPVCIEEASDISIQNLPSDLNVTVTLTPGSAAGAPGKPGDASDPVVCVQSSQACTVAHTFNDAGKEWWDINLGLTIPGIRETTFSLDEKSSTVTSSISRHTDVYGFFSIYWPISYWRPKDSNWPHLDVGIPFSGQPLHRPFFGAAEKIPGLEKLLSMPVSVYGGAIRLIEQRTSLTVGSTTDATTFAGALNKKSVSWRGVVGLEFQVSSLLSKIGSFGGGGGGGKNKAGQ